MDFRVENNGGGTNTDFEDWTPNMTMMDDGDNVYLGLFDVVAAFDPYLAAADALIDLLLSGNQGSIDFQDYKYVDFHIPIDSSENLPASQDDSVGIKIDVENYADPSDDYEQVNTSSEFGYVQVDGYGYTNYSTDVVDVYADYDPV